LAIRFAAEPGGDATRPHSAKKLGIVGQRLGELPLEPRLAGRLPREPLQAIRGALDQLVAAGHLRVGGSSFVASRQSAEAAWRAATAAVAAAAAAMPLQRAFPITPR